MREVIFVVGTGRSGSSALARVLAICGAALPRKILPDNFGNPTGYWEPEVALQINDRLLARHASSWYDVEPALQVDPLPTRERAAFVAEIASFLSTGFHDGDAVVLKEPRISGLLPYWLAAAGDAGARASLIHIFRHPVEVAASLDARDGLANEHAYALWLKYNLFAERDGRRVPRMFVAYDDLLADWEGTIARCTSDLDLGAYLHVTPDARTEVAAFLRPELRHHHATAFPAGMPPEHRLRRTYEVLREAALGRVSAAQFNELRAAYMTWRIAA